MRITLRRSTRSGTEEYVVFKADKENKEEKRLTDFEEVRLELDQRLGERTGSKRKISSEEIQLEIFSPFFAFDLQIIALLASIMRATMPKRFWT